MVKKKNLKTYLEIEYNKLRASALRDPRPTKEVAVRMRLHRVESIIRGRYGQNHLWELQGQRVYKA